MKKILSVLALAVAGAAFLILPLAAFAGSVEVLGFDDVRIDGQPAGRLVDVLANYKERRAEINAAALVWQKKCEDEQAAAIEAAKKAVATAQTAQAAAEEKLAAVLAAIDAVDAEKGKPDVAARAKLREARRTRAEKQRAELQAKKAELEAELAKLSAK